MRYYLFLTITFLSIFTAAGSFSAETRNKGFTVRPDHILALIEALNFIPAQTQQALLKDSLEALAAYNRLSPKEQQRVRMRVDQILQEINQQR